MNSARQFLLGLGFLKVGFQCLKTSRGLWHWAVIPWLVDISLFVVGFIFGANHFSIWATELLLWILPGPIESWSSWLMYPTAFLFWIAFLVLLIYFIYAIGLLVAGPFMSFMAESILKKYGLKSQVSFLAMLKVAILKSVVFLMLGVILFVLSFIPGLNLISSFSAFMILAFDSMDYSFEASGFTFSTRIRFFFRHLPVFLGMASVLGLTLLLPGLTLIVLPFAVAGAAVIFPAHWDPKLRIPRGQVVAAASIVSPKY